MAKIKFRGHEIEADGENHPKIDGLPLVVDKGGPFSDEELKRLDDILPFKRIGKGWWIEPK